MKRSPEICLWPRNNRFNFRHDPDYDPDSEFLFKELCLGPRNNSLNVGDDPEYQQDPDPIHIHCGGLQSLTDCLVRSVFGKM